MDTSIASETLTFYERFSERDSFVDRERGEEDGRSEYPPSSQSSFSTYEVYRISEARGTLNQYVRRVRLSLDRMDERIQVLTTKRDQDYASRKRLLHDRKRSDLSDLANLNGPAAQQYRELEAAQQEANFAYRTEEFRAGRPPRLLLNRPIVDLPYIDWLSPYLAILILLAGLEVPVNVLAVELAFGFNPPFSYVIAFLVGASFVMLAHFIGIQILRIGWRYGWGKLGHVVLLLGAFLLASFMVYILYEMRGQVTQYLGGTIGAADLLAQTGQAAQGDETEAPRGFLGTLMALLSDPLNVLFGVTGANSPIDDTRFAQIGLLLLNVLVLLIGTALSTARHDPDPQLERAWNAKSAADRRTNRFVRTYRRRAAEIERQTDYQVGAISRQADQIGDEILMLQRERAQIENQMQNDIRIVLNVLAQQIASYQEGNRKTRGTPVPPYFGRAGMQRIGDEILLAR